MTPAGSLAPDAPTFPPHAAAPSASDMGAFDMDAAQEEGWTLARSDPSFEGSRDVQLQRLDEATTFRSDMAAWRHVVARARDGSPLHRTALEMISDAERMWIIAWAGCW